MNGLGGDGFTCMHKKDKTADIINIKCEIRKFKMFCSLNRLSDFGSVFTVGLVATRSSKLDPMSIYFDDFFGGCNFVKVTCNFVEVTSNQSYIQFTEKVISKLSESYIQ